MIKKKKKRKESPQVEKQNIYPLTTPNGPSALLVGRHAAKVSASLNVNLTLLS